MHAQLSMHDSRHKHGPKMRAWKHTSWLTNDALVWDEHDTQEGTSQQQHMSWEIVAAPLLLDFVPPVDAKTVELKYVWRVDATPLWSESVPHVDAMPMWCEYVRQSVVWS